MNKHTDKSITLIAEIVGCSAPYVSRVLNGNRADESALAKNIKYTARLVAENREKQQKRDEEALRQIKQEISSK